MRLYEITETKNFESDFNDVFQRIENVDEYLPIIKDYIENERFIYRGINSHEDMFLANGHNLKRKSKNTTNLYTDLIDFLPSWRKYPKRSKSFICSTGIQYASSYGSVFHVIPLEKQPMGICSQNDFWSSFPYIGKELIIYSMPDFNQELSDIFRKYQVPFDPLTEKSLEELDQKIQEQGGSSTNELLMMFFKNGVFKTLSNLMNPENNNFTLLNYSNYRSSMFDNKELWLSGKVLMMREHELRKIKNRL